jgi:ribosomal protein L11
MVKKSNHSDRPGGIEIQRGALTMKDQYNIGFEKYPDMTRTDIENIGKRIEGMTLTKHEPKR